MAKLEQLIQAATEAVLEGLKAAGFFSRLKALEDRPQPKVLTEEDVKRLIPAPAAQVDLSPLEQRLKALEERPVPVTPNVEHLAASAAELVQKAMPKPEPVPAPKEFDPSPIEQRLKALEDHPAPDVEAAVKQAVADFKAKIEKELAGTFVKHGKDGEPGRDALQIEILPAIDVTRSYARGTFVSHRGGVLRAARATDPLDGIKDGETAENKGWHVVVNGMAERAIEQLDERTFAIRMTDTLGKVMELKFALPMMIYRNVWRQGPYKQGDTVTWAGSLWHCNADTDEKPGTSKAWTLAAKKGTDAKDRPDANR